MVIAFIALCIITAIVLFVVLRGSGIEDASPDEAPIQIED